MSYTNFSHSINDLFGNPNIKMTYDLPCHIGTLAERLNNSGFYYSESELIRKHTLFNLYEPFLPDNLVHKTYNRMIGGGSLGLHASLGLCSSNVPMLEYFKYFPVCDEEFTGAYGETYVHRIHQNPCMDVCPYHKIPLMNSQIHVNELETIHNKSLNSLISLSDYDFSILIRIAESYEYIVSGRLQCSHTELKKKYRHLLKEHGYLYGNSRLNIDKIRKAFTGFYGDRLLKRLGSQVDDVNSNWLLSIFRNADRIVHPIRHILVILFLSGTINTFSKYAPLSELKPSQRKNAARNDFEHHYMEMLALIEKYPENGRQELRRMNNAAYQWLNIHDKVWFEQHMPMKRIPKPIPKAINWPEKDLETLDKVKSVVLQLLMERKPFVRVTIQMVCSRTDEKYRILKNLNKLVKTKEYLDMVKESPLQFQYRKIYDVMKRFHRYVLSEDLIYEEACIVKCRFREVDVFIESLFAGERDVNQNTDIQRN